MRFPGIKIITAALASITLLASCDTVPGQPPTGPKARPAGLVKPPPPVTVAPPSKESDDLRYYYNRVQNDLLAQGLLRTDGGGHDTPFTSTSLARNFERIVFYDEYARNRGLSQPGNTPAVLRRWQSPIRLSLEFGASVPAAQRAADRTFVTNFAHRLARVSHHPVSVTNAKTANFFVLVMGADDTAATLARVRQIAPNIDGASLDVFRNLPRSVHCFVMAFSANNLDQEYSTAIAFVRAEHPDLIRQSCYHEEIAQGMGLANDSPQARPSIFNDDDEFAYLTTHDERLLQILYDPRLHPGMSSDQIMPLVRQIAETLVPGPS